MNKNYDFDNVKNQMIKEALVNREVYACISDMTDYLFDYDGGLYGTYDEFENLYVTTCPECGAVNSFDHDVRDDGSLTDYWYCNNCNHEIDEELEGEPQEIYEYWIVSSWFGAKLRDVGEPVFERMSGWIWGRTCTGQAISLDSAINEICKGMEILEGMPHEWRI